MKFRIYMKTPDWDYDLKNEIECKLEAAGKLDGLSKEDRKELVDDEYRAAKDFAYGWIDCEYVHIEFDTEAKTATLLENKRR